LRLNCERLHKFADISSVEGYLDELAERYPPRVVKLARAVGARESRWAHLLCGEVAEPLAAASAGDPAPTSLAAGELAALKAEQTRLAAEVAELRTLVLKMARDLGVDGA
jgi:uncharacterized protein YceH (UPF0502 family)